jgi:proteasome lid subunit RPN8/RPN11
VTTSPLVDVRRFLISEALLEETIAVLLDAGRHGHEAFVLWSGMLQDRTALRFTSVIVPEQTPHRTPDGLLVTVDGPALFAAGREAYSRGEMLAGQVHTHPTDAYHSEVDDHFPLVTMLGSLSVVLPDFALGGRRDVARWAWYRLVGEGRWQELTRADKVEVSDE